MHLFNACKSVTELPPKLKACTLHYTHSLPGNCHLFRGRQQPTPAVSVQHQQFSSSRNKAGALDGTSIATTAAQLCSSLAGAEQAGARRGAARALIALDPDGRQQQPGAPCSCREEQLQRRDCSGCCRTGMGSSQPLAAALGRAPAAFQALAWGRGCSLSAHVLIAWLGGRGEV